MPLSCRCTAAGPCCRASLSSTTTSRRGHSSRVPAKLCVDSNRSGSLKGFRDVGRAALLSPGREQRAVWAGAVGRPRASVHASEVSSGISSLAEADLIPVVVNGEFSVFPTGAGVYAVYSPQDKLQYIGISKQVSSSIKGHMQDLPDLVGSVKVLEVDSNKDALMAAWKAWVQETLGAAGAVPPGNAPGVK
eukprot:CAMPEP_0117661570 /NCGR_PEP_ID=MMETSP0804-20121206/7607_1 /TAXON_ID=1074897 /ORGANISM="Tetraselmis astigmatica, Strain CCMP880" /LENGTH=190 /DNA_ID=CAMNT_0005468445 /DNA_START=111 /DNA_END=680 /DNA_ORIENTATION=+